MLGKLSAQSWRSKLMVGMPYSPPWWLRNGWAMTAYIGRGTQALGAPEPASSPVDYQELDWHGADGVPLCVWGAIAPASKLASPLAHRAPGTIIGTYGITGSLSNQWILQIAGREAIARGYSVVLFDWRGHGETARRSPRLGSDGLRDGWDYLHLAAQAKAAGYPAPYWLLGYSLGGQLALWGVHYATPDNLASVGLAPADLGGAVVMCPNLDANRSLAYLQRHSLGRQVERMIARTLRQQAIQLAAYHPTYFDRTQTEQISSIVAFDEVMVLPQWDFASVADYYTVSSPLPFLADLTYPVGMLYAADDPLFAPELISELRDCARRNPKLHLGLTAKGGHVGYISSCACQRAWGDRDRWWGWHRLFDWLDAQTQAPMSVNPASRLVSP